MELVTISHKFMMWFSPDVTNEKYIGTYIGINNENWVIQLNVSL